MAEPSRIRRQLGADLRALRTLAGLSQRDLQTALPSTQSTVSRMERGEALPSRAQVELWLRECAADPDTRARVLALTEAAHGETQPWPDMFPTAGARHLQGVAGERETTAALVRNLQLTWLPGLLQTAQYARLMLAQTDPEGQRDTASAIAARLERQQILFEEGRRFEFLVAEAALRWMPDPSVVAGQRDRLLSLATLPTVELAVLPTDRIGSPAWHSFVLFAPADCGPSYVTTELVHGGQEITDPGAVRLYGRLWERLWAAAAVGDEAVELIRGAAPGR